MRPLTASTVPGLVGAWLASPDGGGRASAPPTAAERIPLLRRHGLRWPPLYALLMGAAHGGTDAYRPM